MPHPSRIRALAGLLAVALLLSSCTSLPFLWRLGAAGDLNYTKVSWCVPGKLKRVLRRVAHEFGDVTVFSTFRTPWHNARVGGAAKSHHKWCRAVDFTVKGADMHAVYAYVRRHPNVGGHKLYPSHRGGHIHIDTGPRRTW